MIMINNYMEKMKAKGLNFHTFSAPGIDTDAKRKVIQTNEEKLLPTGINPKDQDEPESKQEVLLPTGIKTN